MAQKKPSMGGAQQGQQQMYNQPTSPYYASNPYMYYYPSAPASNQGQGGFPPAYSGGGQVPQMPQGQSGGINPPNMLPTEQSYIENILRLNAGKQATVYMTFENNAQWNAKVFKGIIEAAGRDHIILSDPETGKRYLLLMIYLDYITFDEEINYSYPFNGGGSGFAQYQPR
ncbi:spore germination protein Q [Halobacillus alkaliphilus]|uniref:Spore germination protein Q n=1 Tax=Halobacillus alkaliphilus TaxID=396056 RepID=A0A1I2L9U5_9BACI|nr:spore coat protein GerQ [Halobacillus alkaliphilus]SFF75318.1 spore germination protein Q [Halobacillus alkaliphilus]